MTGQATLPILKQLRSFNRPARLFLLATLVDGIVFSAWSLFFNFYILERGFDRTFLGLVTAAGSLSALLLGIPLGRLSDRIGRKRAMLLGVAIFIIASGLEVTVLQPGMILAMAFLGGAGNSLYYTSQAPFMMKASDEHNRALLFSLNFGLVTLSGAVGDLFAGQLPALFAGLLGTSAHSAAAYQAVLLASVLLGSLTLVPLALLQEPAAALPQQTIHTPTRPLGSILIHATTLKLTIPNLFIGLGAAILIPYMNVFFSDRFGITNQALGLLFSLSALLTGIGSLAGPYLAGILGSKIRAVVLTQGLSLVFLLLIGFSPILWIAGLAFLLRGALMNMSVPLFDAFAMEQITENEQATVNSFRNLAWQLGWVIGPFISGVVQQAYGFPPLFLATAALYLFATSLIWFFFQRKPGSQRGNPDQGFYPA